jgi:hypothetical protein
MAPGKGPSELRTQTDLPSQASPQYPFTGSTHPLLFEAGCGVAIATAGRTSGQCYYRVPHFRALPSNWLALAQTGLYSPRMSRKPVFFLIGFIVGAVVSLFWNAMPIIRAGAAPSIPGIWLDIVVQAVIIGLLLGLVAMWLGTWRRNRT